MFINCVFVTVNNLEELAMIMMLLTVITISQS